MRKSSALPTPSAPRNALTAAALAALLGLGPHGAAAQEGDGQDRGLGELVRDLQRIKDENRELRGEIETLQRQLQKLQRRQREHYKDLDGRLQELRAQGTAPEGGAGSGGEQAAGQAGEIPIPELSEAEGSSDTPSEQALYERAFGKLNAGDYAQARAGLERLLERFPEGEYADNARYWIAETYYAESRLDQAAEHFERVLERHPDSGKAADAQLKLGYIAFKRGELETARKRLERVREQYPESTAAGLAEERLTQIRQTRTEQ